MSGIDTKIEPLVKFLNQLDGVITIGSCQGHDDGGGSGEWVYPYIKFKCTNNRTLGFLASLEDAYKSINEQAELKYFNSSLAFEPDLNGDWCIEVVKNIDFNEQHIDGEYAMYVLRANTNSFNKPSDIYGDFNEILNWYKYQLKLMGQKVFIK